MVRILISQQHSMSILVNLMRTIFHQLQLQGKELSYNIADTDAAYECVKLS